MRVIPCRSLPGRCRGHHDPRAHVGWLRAVLRLMAPPFRSRSQEESPTEAPQVRVRMKINTGIPHTKRNSAAHDGTVARMTVQPS
jgi:hypothetical protein